jgi:CHAD domain-containing protein
MSNAAFASALAVRRALIGQLEGAISALETLEPEEAVHRCRVHLKRCRTLARVGAPAAPAEAELLNAKARDLMGRLSASRDLTAMTACARKTAETAADEARAGLEALIARLESERGAAGPETSGFVEAKAGLQDLLLLARAWPPSTGDQVRGGIVRLIRRARRKYREAAASNDPAVRHTWRKREKDRLYAANLLEDEWPPDRPRRRAHSDALSETLGTERDAVLLIDRVRDDPPVAGADAEAVIAALEKRRDELAAEADRLAATLHRGRG